MYFYYALYIYLNREKKPIYKFLNTLLITSNYTCGIYKIINNKWSLSMRDASPDHSLIKHKLILSKNKMHSTSTQHITSSSFRTTNQLEDVLSIRLSVCPCVRQGALCIAVAFPELSITLAARSTPTFEKYTSIISQLKTKRRCSVQLNALLYCIRSEY